MKVLYISYDGLTDPLGQSQILPYIIGLTKHGHSFHIISFEKTGNYSLERKTIENIIERHPITWHPLIYHKKPPVVSTLLDIRNMRRKSKGLVEAERFDLVHCRSYISGLVGLELKRKFDIKFLFDIRGFWADERIDGGIWSLKNPIYHRIYNFFKKKEIQMMDSADHIISLTHAGKAEIVSGNLFNGKAKGIPKEKVTVIPCAVDLDLFDLSKIEEDEKRKLKESIGLEKADEVLVYLGSIGTWYLLDEMLLYFKDFHQNHRNSFFLFVTQDAPTIILQRAAHLGIDPVSIIVTGAARKEVPLHLSLATQGIFFIKPAYSKKASSATKMAEMMAMNLPMLTNAGIGDAHYYGSSESRTWDILPIIRIDQEGVPEEFKLSNSIEQYSKVYDQLILSEPHVD